MTLFKNTYRIETARLVGYDYASPGWYHVVMCTKGRVCYFGEVIDGVLHPTGLGRLAHAAWPETLDRYHRAVLDAFVVMPNHVHVIVGLASCLATVETRPASVETRRGASLPVDGNTNFGPLPSHSVSSIINHYKGRVTKRARRQGRNDFAWQPRFWDRVIRTRRELRATRQYIIDNPARWTTDRLNQ